MRQRWTGPVVVALCALFVATAAGAQETRDSEERQETRMASARPADPPPLPLDRNELVEVRTLSDERTVEFVIGPVALEAGIEHFRLPIQMAEFPVDGWMHGFEMEMVDGNGTPIPSELLHHVNFIDPDKRELFSPIARRVMAAGRETSTQRLPGVIGYPIADGDRMLISAMFANVLGRDFDDAHLVVRFFYSTESDRLIQPRDIYPFYLDVMGPLGAKDFRLPPGRTVKAWEGKPAVDGRILGIGGHVHDYATRLALIDVTEGKTLWEVEPEGTPGGRITGVPSDRFLWSLGKKIDADHVYRIEVEYHNPLDEPAPDGGMGAIGGAVWVGKDARWPEFDRTNEIYLGDLENTLTAPDRRHGHGGMSSQDHAAHDAAADESPADEPYDDGAMQHDGAHGH